MINISYYHAWKNNLVIMSLVPDGNGGESYAKDLHCAGSWATILMQPSMTSDIYSYYI